MINVAVWGTGNVGRPAIRAVLANPELALAGVVVSNPDKVGRDAADLADIATPTGMAATDDAAALLQSGAVDAVAYTASCDFRPDEALTDIVTCLESGADVVTPGIYGLYHPPSAPPEIADPVTAACAAGDASIYATGIDPGWAQDVLPLFASGMVTGIDEIRCQEIFNYGLYAAPDAVRDLIGFGRPLDETPMMLLPGIPTSVWGPSLRTMADGFGIVLDEITEWCDRLPLTETVEVPGMGTFEAGTQGALRFELHGKVNGRTRLVIDHVTRIHDDCAPDWPTAPPGSGGSAHVLHISGQTSLSIGIHARDGASDNPADGGNATAAARLVNAIPAVVAAPAGMVHPLDLPTPRGHLTV